MTNPRNDQAACGTIQGRLSRHNHTVHHPAATDQPLGLHNGAIQHSGSQSPPQIIRSNRERVEAGRPLIYADDPHPNAAAVYDLNVADEGHLSNGDHVKVATLNARGNIIGSQWRNRGSVDGLMAGQGTLLARHNADEHDGTHVQYEPCRVRQEVDAHVREVRQREGSFTFARACRILHSNDPQRNDNIQGVEYSGNNTVNRGDRTGYPTIAPRPSAVRRHEHSTGSSPCADSRHVTQGYYRQPSDHGLQHAGRVSSIGHAGNNPVIRASSYDSHSQRLHDAGVDHNRNVRAGSVASVSSMHTLGATGRSTNQDMERHVLNRRIPVGDPNCHPALEQGFRGSYPLDQHSSGYDNPVLAVQMAAQGHQFRATTDQQAINRLDRSPPTTHSCPTTNAARPSASPDRKSSPDTSVSSINTTLGGAGGNHATPWNRVVGQPAFKNPGLNVSRRPLYAGSGVDPRAFIRPPFAVPHTDEPITGSTMTANVNVEGMPVNFELLDQFGGPQRPTTQIGDRDHIVGWNGTKLPHLQPNPFAMLNSKLGPKPGVEWCNAHEYGLHSHTAFELAPLR